MKKTFFASLLLSVNFAVQAQNGPAMGWSSFPSVNSGGWQTVVTRTIDIQLQKGRNSIRLSNASNWMPDIGYIQLNK